jgi:hypothetical protein
MTLHNSWKSFLLSLTAANESGDRNIPGFTGAMNFESSADEKMTALNEPNGVLLTANNRQEIVLLHNPKNFGGTLLRPTDKIGCLLGVGHNAMPVIIDETAALQPLQVAVPPLAEIAACSSIDDLRALATPAVNGLVNLEAINIFFPAPFLRNAILNENISSPLALILVAINAGIEHINIHQNDANFDENDVNDHIDLFMTWCMGVHQASVPETRFSVDPDDDELAAFSLRLHSEHIMPATTTAPTGLPTGTSDVFRSLAAGITRSHEEAEHQNRLHREQLDFIKDKEAKKKNKYEKWHDTSRRLVLNAASEDADEAADSIPSSYLRIINSETAGMADRELQSQMRILGHEDAGFAHGLAASLYNGDILWSSPNSPSNLSPFTVFELDPLSSAQNERCVQLHLLSKNTEGKSLEEIKASQKQEVKVPETFEELVQSFVFYSGITTILFSNKSALANGIKMLIFCIRRDKIAFKTRIAGDKEFATKFIFAVEIRIQRWLRACMMHDDRSMIDDRLVNFDPVVESVLNSTLNIVLPPNFIVASSTTKPTNPTVVSPDEDTKKKNPKKRKSGNGDDGNDRIVKNNDPIKDFLLRDGEDWSRDYAGKCTGDRPKYGDTDWVCARWWVKGQCFRDCGNKASHVGASNFPPAKRCAFQAYLTKVRGEITPTPTPSV